MICFSRRIKEKWIYDGSKSSTSLSGGQASTEDLAFNLVESTKDEEASDNEIWIQIVLDAIHLP